MTKDLSFHSYMDSLKSALEYAEKQGPAVPLGESGSIDPQKPYDKEKLFTRKNILWVLGVCVIGISVVAFVTQLVLLAIDNGRSEIRAVTPTAVANSTVESPDPVYIRSDLEGKVFGNKEDELKPGTDLGIPGVSKIGFDARTPNKALTDNINKYTESTLVVGGREVEVGADEDDLANQGRYSLLSTPAQPVLSSKAYLVADIETGEIILEKNSEAIHPLASVSKLMTSVVAREKMDMQSIAIVSRDASRAYGGQGNLGLGEKIRLADLLFPLLMESSNDAAEVFADQFGHAKFMEEMNKKAAEIGMLDTYYGDPSGLDPRNTSSPKDLLKLARYIYKHDPQIYDITRVKQFSIKGHTWLNRNGLLSTQGFAGGKNGYIDQSRQTTVSLFDVSVYKGGTRTVVVIILRSEDKNNDVAKLLNYLKKAAIYEVK